MKIKDLPQPIKELVLKRQVEQGNEPNEELYLISGKKRGNFDWIETIEEDDFWNKIDLGNFKPFYDLYPQNVDTSVTPKEKAKELVDKIKTGLWRDRAVSIYSEDATYCANIAVDEIIEQIKNIIDEAPNIYQSLGTNKKLCIDVLNPILKYWQDVKSEI